jgi:hypothetical protein
VKPARTRRGFVPIEEIMAQPGVLPFVFVAVLAAPGLAAPQAEPASQPAAVPINLRRLAAAAVVQLLFICLVPGPVLGVVALRGLIGQA